MPSDVGPDDFKAAIADPSDPLCGNFKDTLLKLPVLVWKLVRYMLNPDMTPTDEFIDDVQHIRPGHIIMSARTAENTSQFLVCNGQAVGRVAYSRLFDVIGTTFGVGDGSTTFNVPDFRNRFPIGAGITYDRGSTGGSATATLAVENLAPHSHGVPGTLDATGTDSGCSGGCRDVIVSESEIVGNGEPFSVLNPYLGIVFLIKF